MVRAFVARLCLLVDTVYSYAFVTHFVQIGIKLSNVYTFVTRISVCEFYFVSLSTRVLMF
jgi:hypothetical protein